MSLWSRVSTGLRFALWCLGHLRIQVQSRPAGSMCTGALGASVSDDTIK
ncbi:MAG TPA: hypothetical protein VFW03_26275 [Gemmatimonadaceae bacterium]|nr:hypothetical protein [Gemmatimonadaceae bacterium]